MPDLTWVQLGALIWLCVTLAVTDGAALSRLGIAWLAKRLGLQPAEIVRFEAAADGGGE
ncbi:hypothetical protein [Haloarcula argentinensis]|uniref:Uncharacterized protein n=1 Tax=Haloarcula argentinensis TaxID=43776 RepID=A0A830FQ85_HALAR|nr:hypothetical protein [Haloarcula argentinensis]GGM46331.1 hypothetical protein GCM10009006_29520 [Haloarcula argentinensis]